MKVIGQRSKVIGASTIAAAAALLLAMPLRAQQAPPATEVYLAQWRPGATPAVNAWTNISNDPDYDNQPSFLPDSSAILFTSRRDTKQTDIYRYDIATKAVKQLTHTPESEYSAVVTPDRKSFSVIRVEADGQTQRLWRFDLDGSNPRLVLENVKPVGYHAWIDDTHLALFILGGGSTLQIADTTKGTAEVVETGIGRSILIRPGVRTVSYMTTGENHMVKQWDPKTRASAPLFAPLDGSQDAVWLSEVEMLMANGTKIMRRAPMDFEWSLLADLDKKPAATDPGVSPPAIKSITRMAVSPDGKWLAFVAEPAVAK